MSSRAFRTAALAGVVAVVASCAHSDAAETATSGGDEPSAGGGLPAGTGGSPPGAGPGGLGVGGFEVASSGAGGDGAAGGAGGAPASTGTAGAGGEGGAVTPADASGTELVSAGQVASSPGYTVVLSVGQPSPAQDVMTSPGYRFEGGLIGVNGSLP